MIVNNLIVDTLNPSNIIAQIYSNKFSKQKQEYLIWKCNHFLTSPNRLGMINILFYLKTIHKL